jgi:hypothetical protein
MIEHADFKRWACACAERGWAGPFTLYGKPDNSYQYTGERGSMAMWNGERNRGYIFGPGEAAPIEAHDTRTQLLLEAHRIILDFGNMLPSRWKEARMEFLRHYNGGPPI